MLQGREEQSPIGVPRTPQGAGLGDKDQKFVQSSGLYMLECPDSVVNALATKARY